MKMFLSTCVSGTEKAIETFFIQDLIQFQPVLVLDGLIAYKTSTPISRIQSLPYLNNTFLLLKRFENLPSPGIAQMLTAVTRDRRLEGLVSQSVTNKERTFRIVTSYANRLLSVDRCLRNQAEGWIAKLTRLTVHPTHPDTEFWFLQRNEGDAFFLKRITRRAVTERGLTKGELRPELASILCRLSEPHPEDVFLDPFCGTGAIPLQRALIPYNLIFAIDNDPDKIKLFKAKLKASKRSEKRWFKKIIAAVGDAHNLTRFTTTFVDKIVTDPPWGVYSGTSSELPQFYSKALEEMFRILKRGGIIVILTAQKDLMESLIRNFHERLYLGSRYDILVAGQKAAIFKMVRNHHD